MTDPKTTDQRFTREPMEHHRSQERREADRRTMTPYQAYIEERLGRFFGKCLMIFAVLGVSCAAGLLGFGIVLHKQHEFTKEIQRQRYDTALTSCNETNSRNLDVNNKIDQAIAALPPKQRAKADKQSQAFRLIISASVPLTLDCYAYAEDRTQGAGQ